MDTKRIQLDFNQAMAKAAELEEIGNELLKAVNGDYEEALQLILAGWKGGNAEAYLRNGTRLEKEMLRTARQVLQCAQQIRRTANRIYRAEMEAARIAGIRTY